MRILAINPPYLSITTARGLGSQVPLGLILIGGSLLAEGHEVRLLDAEARRLSYPRIVRETIEFAPDAVLTGHAGSTPAHPAVLEMAAEIKAELPDIPIIYGGVFPTYHAREILEATNSIDIIVRGEGEKTIAALIGALETGGTLSEIAGIAFRGDGEVVLTRPAEMIADLDLYRRGWELIEDWDLYRCWGLGRSAVVQFSRGCPHRCTYCGQRGFWTKWRYRNPKAVAAEIAWLHREKGVNFIDLADENPTSSKRLWREFLEAVIAENLNVRLFATIRAPDIVRDADILPLYKMAGFDCVLMGMETTDPTTLAKIRKGSTTRDDRDAIRLLRQHGILSMVGHIVGFEEENFADYWNALRQLLHYDPDLLNAMYVTPHRWTAFYGDNEEREAIEPDQKKWDYRHQVLGTRNLKPWRILLLVKLTELAIHLRPRALWRLMNYSDPAQRRAYRWCFRNAGNVWLHEIFDALSQPRPSRRMQLRDMGKRIKVETPLTAPASQI